MYFDKGSLHIDIYINLYTLSRSSNAICQDAINADLPVGYGMGVCGHDES